MKNLTYTLVALVLGFVIITGCKKNEGINKEKLIGKNSLNTKNDTVITPPPADTVLNVPLTGDKITLTPITDQSIGDSVHIAFNALTANSYCSNGILKFNKIFDANNGFHVDFLHIQTSITCSGINIPIFGGINFQTMPLANGSYPLVMTLNGTTYTGNVVISTSSITFDWNYTTGIVISPKTIQR